MGNPKASRRWKSHGLASRTAAIGLATVLGAGLLVLGEHVRGQGPCWQMGTIWCSVCGITTPCSQQLCVQSWDFLYYCPEESYEILPNPGYYNTWVPACQEAPSGYWNCTTQGGQTFWCTTMNNCDTETACRRNPEDGRYYCVSLGTPGARCGIVSAIFSNLGCPGHQN